MCNVNPTSNTTQNSNTSFNQQSISDFLSKMSQTSQSNTAQTGTNTSTTGPSDAARKMIEQGTRSISGDQINQYMSPYQQQVLDATVAQLNQQSGVQQNQLRGNAVSMGALGGDRAKVAQAQLMGEQGRTMASTVAGIQNQGYSQALSAAQAEQNRMLQGAGMMGTTTTGSNTMAGQTAGTMTGENMSHGTSDTSGTSQTSGSSNTTSDPGVIGYGTMIAGMFADGGAVHRDMGGANMSMPTGWMGPQASQNLGFAPATPDYSSMYQTGKKARKGLNQMMDKWNKSQQQGQGDQKQGQGFGQDQTQDAGTVTEEGTTEAAPSSTGMWSGDSEAAASMPQGWAGPSGGMSGAGSGMGEGAGAAGEGAASGIGEGVSGAGAAAGEGVSGAATGAGEGASAAGAEAGEGLGALIALLARGGRAHRADGGGDYPMEIARSGALGGLANLTAQGAPDVGRAIQDWEVKNAQPAPAAAPVAQPAPGSGWMDRLLTRVAPSMTGVNEPSTALPAPQPGIAAMGSSLGMSPGAELAAMGASSNVLPKAQPQPAFRTALENVPAELTGSQTPVTSFRVNPAGESMAEPGAEQIAPGGLKGDNGLATGISARGINRLKGYEGFSSKPFEDYGSKRIGYGVDVQPGDTVITEEEADKRLREKTAGAEAWIGKNVKTPLNQDQYDSLVSFYHNSPEGAKSLLPALNKGDYAGAADHMLLYNKVTNPKTGQKELSPGLLARRHGEADLMRSTSGEASNRDVPATEPSKGALAPAKVQANPGILERVGINQPDPNFKPAYPGQEPEKGGLIQRLTGMKFNPLGLSDRERWALMGSSGVAQFGQGAQIYANMRGQDISAAQHGQQLALEAMKTNQGMAQPTVMNEVMGPFGEVHKQYGRFNPATNTYEPYSGSAAGAAASPYGGVKGDLHDQVIQALHSGKAGDEVLKLMPPEVATVARAVGSYERAPMQGKAADSPQGQIEFAAAKAFNPDYDPSQYSIMQKTRQEMLSGPTSKVLKAGVTGLNHLAEFFEEAEKNRISDFPGINKAGNYVAEALRKPGGIPARDLAGSASEETTTFYRGTGGTEGDIERHLGTLNENMSEEQRKSMAGVIARKMEGKINSVELSRDEAFKGAAKKAPPFMTPEARESLAALKLYARDPKISMVDARKAVKEGATANEPVVPQRTQITETLSVPTSAVAELLQNPKLAAKFDEHYKTPGAAAKALAMYQKQGAKP